ncbi:MAG: helix-turn-helix domain-containing protein [Dehalococcoidia bacterium]
MNVTADHELRRDVGYRLRALRAASGKSQETVVQEIGITQAALSNYETGKREVPLSTLVRLARHFDVSLDTLVFGASS